MTGRIYAVVGPSGAGKDTLMMAAAAVVPDLMLVRRVITRPTEAGGEDFEGVTAAEFQARKAKGEFALDWVAHGLCYGIPASIAADLQAGRDVMFNGSRGALVQAQALFAGLCVLHVTAPVAVLADRLAARGREARSDIAARLARAGYALPDGLDVRVVVNDGSLAQGVARFLAALQPVRA